MKRKIYKAPYKIKPNNKYGNVFIQFNNTNLYTPYLTEDEMQNQPEEFVVIHIDNMVGYGWEEITEEFYKNVINKKEEPKLNDISNPTKWTITTTVTDNKIISSKEMNNIISKEIKGESKSSYTPHIPPIKCIKKYPDLNGFVSEVILYINRLTHFDAMKDNYGIYGLPTDDIDYRFFESIKAYTKLYSIAKSIRMVDASYELSKSDDEDKPVTGFLVVLDENGEYNYISDSSNLLAVPDKETCFAFYKEHTTLWKEYYGCNI